MAKRRPFTMSVVVSEYRGDWSATVQYYAGDIIRHTGIVWLALRRSLNTPPPESETWTEILPAAATVTITQADLTTIANLGEVTLTVNYS